jgi:hypothetical protein
MPNREEIHVCIEKMLFPTSTGGTAASLSTTLTGANNDIVLTARQAGLSGNTISLTLVDPSGNNQALAVTVSGNDISASLATGAGGAITTTAAQLLAAIAASAAANSLVSGANKTGNDGSGVVTALTKTNLTGGLATGTITSAALDCQGFDSAHFNFHVGPVAAAPTSITIQESDDNTTFTDAAAAAVVGAADVSGWAINTTLRIAYVGTKRYCRAVVVLSAATVLTITGHEGYAAVKPPANPA